MELPKVRGNRYIARASLITGLLLSACTAVPEEAPKQTGQPEAAAADTVPTEWIIFASSQGRLCLDLKELEGALDGSVGDSGDDPIDTADAKRQAEDLRSYSNFSKILPGTA